jgi:protease II
MRRARAAVGGAAARWMQRRSGGAAGPAAAATARFATTPAPPRYPCRPDEHGDPYGWMRTADPDGELSRYLAQEARLYRSAGLGSSAGWAATRGAIERQAEGEGGGHRDAPEPSGPYEYWQQDDELPRGWMLMRRRRREADSASCCLSAEHVRRDAALAVRRLFPCAAARPSFFFSSSRHRPEDLFGPDFDSLAPEVRLSRDHGLIAYLLPYAPSAAARSREERELPPDGASLLVVRAVASGPEAPPLAMFRAATGAEFSPWTEEERAPGAALYYVEPDARTGRPWRVCRRRLSEAGDGNGGDPVLFEEHDPRHFVALTRTKDWRALVVNSHSKLSSEVRLMLGPGASGGGGGGVNGLAPDDVPSSLLLIAPRRPGVEYFVEHRQGRVLVLTNAPELFLSREGATADPAAAASSTGRDYALLAAPLLVDEPPTWRLGPFEMLAPEPRGRCRVATSAAADDDDDAAANNSPALAPLAATTDLDVFDAGIVLQQRDAVGRPALSVVSISDDGASVLRARLPRWALELEPHANQDASSSSSSSPFRFDLSSPSRPPEPHELDLSTGEVRPLVLPLQRRRAAAAPRLVCRRLVAPCLPGDGDGDGDEDEQAGVPITVLYRASTKTPTDLSLPLARVAVLEAYGAYGRPLEASWRADRAALALERGWVFALAHARGGGELGRRWHWLGRGSRKARSARDVVAAARFLVREGFVEEGEDDRGGASSNSRRIALMASSAGAVAAAGALLAEPQLFGAAVLEVPFVDALAEMRGIGGGAAAEAADHPLDLLAQHEQDEWGDDDDDDDKDAAQTKRFRALERGACPYQALLHLSRQGDRRALPPLLLTAAADDARVRPQGVARFAALYRDAAPQSTAVLLRLAAEGGHLGGSTCAGDAGEAAELYEFVRRWVEEERGEGEGERGGRRRR